ncbi:MAG: PilZ domain-containing protein [bacterium]|nr:PilZ domain-containing protein [bacterium]
MENINTQQVIFLAGILLFAVSAVLLIIYFLKPAKQGETIIKTSKNPSKERRRYVRIPVGTSIKYKIINRQEYPLFCSLYCVKKEGDRIVSAGDGTKKGYTANISASGVLFKVKEKLSEGMFLHLTIETSNKEYSLELNGKIIRVDKHSELGFYEIAVAFLKPTEEEESKLAEFVSEHFF